MLMLNSESHMESHELEMHKILSAAINGMSHSNCRSMGIDPATDDPEKFVCRKETIFQNLASLSDEAFSLAYLLVSEPEKIQRFFKTAKNTKLLGHTYKGVTPIEQKRITRRMLTIYLREHEKLRPNQCRQVIAEIACYAVKILLERV